MSQSVTTCLTATINDGTLVSLFANGNPLFRNGATTCSRFLLTTSNGLHPSSHGLQPTSFWLPVTLFPDAKHCQDFDGAGVDLPFGPGGPNIASVVCPAFSRIEDCQESQGH